MKLQILVLNKIEIVLLPFKNQIKHANSAFALVMNFFKYQQIQNVSKISQFLFYLVIHS